MLDIILVQMESLLSEKTANFAKVKTLLDNAGIVANDGGKADGGVGTVAGDVRTIAGGVGQAAGCKCPRLIVLPEMFDVGYIPQQPEKYAEDFDSQVTAGDCNGLAASGVGRNAGNCGLAADGVRRNADGNVGGTAEFLQQLANETGDIVFGAGIAKVSAKKNGEAAQDETSPALRNRSAVFVPGGNGAVSAYDKVHPFFPELNRGFASGDSITLFKIGGWKIASVICYDLRFPELFRDAVKLGANLITVQAAWPKVRKAHWETLLRARAIENQVYIAAVNGVSPSEQDPTKQLAGTSMLIDPLGNVIASGSDSAEEIIRGQVHLEPLKKYRQDFPVLQGIAPQETALQDAAHLNANPQGTNPQGAAALTSPRDAT